MRRTMGKSMEQMPRAFGYQAICANRINIREWLSDPTQSVLRIFENPRSLAKKLTTIGTMNFRISTFGCLRSLSDMCFGIGF